MPADAARTRALLNLRAPAVVLPVLIAAPLPIAAALLLTGRPAYPADACFYGAPQSSLMATDRYLGLMTPLAMVALAVVAALALPARGRWRVLALAVAAWALAALLVTDAARPAIVYGGHLAVFGLFFSVPLVVITIVAGREYSWVRAIGWFEFLYLLPLLLGVAGLLAQPACFAGDAPAPIAR